MSSSLKADMAYPNPHGGASLLLAVRFSSSTVLVLGSGPLAASRAFAALDADSKVVVLAKGGLEAACDEIRWRISQDQVTFVDWDTLPSSSSLSGEDKDMEALESYVNSTPNIRMVCVTDTLTGHQKMSRSLAERVYTICNSRNIMVNTTDLPNLCDFTFTATHRFEDHEGKPSPLQIGVTTNGQGCRLAGRLRRDIVSKLPRNVGSAVSKVGRMRSSAKASAAALRAKSQHLPEDEDISDNEMEENSGVTTPNRPVPSRSASETETQSSKRRIKWVAQVSEYWPISKLADMTEKEMDEVLAGDVPLATHVTEMTESQHALQIPKQGKILLLGSGPGHPSLLTVATHTALTRMADLVLSDKLVPDAVLNLIPKTVEVRIARKFPGNAEASQIEMMEAAVEAARLGKTVVRLKQGDPVVYGRAGEEVLYFRAHGFEPVVIPGVSSALAAPTFAGIPVTQRGVAESFVVCTGVGRKGKEVQLPGYDRAKTLVILMGVARLPQVVKALVEENQGGRREGPAFPPHTPIAIIERASMPDQRVISSTLKDIVGALESVGEQRPPGMIVVGWSVLALWGAGDVEVLDEKGEHQDEARVQRWLGDSLWRITEGLADAWEDF